MNKAYTNIIDFTLIYNLHKKPLYNYVLKMLNQRSIADDIIQNVFLKLFNNLKNIRQAQSVQAWLYTTARNEVYIHYRKKKIKKENYIDTEHDFIADDNLAAIYEEREIAGIIETELNNMNEELKEVFLLREYSDLSYKEIAEILCIEQSLVKSRLFRARTQLVDRISKLIK